jgi:hypothetical protein
MTEPTATNTDLAHAATRTNIDASGYVVGVEFCVPRSVVRELAKAGMPAFGLREWGAC